ncbi:LLM class flavin-dependent oxidoreductase [Nitrosopumilus sp.]|uniref:LLM class flavin-dependent oxidoreductase n=1 Tax=Nitrosopumilus sp. TaxID=2024843 RepID=UPI0026144E72|nr:LLM class flavin-dependent oxidoreductase [Nitrosopumilus sp.]
MRISCSLGSLLSIEEVVSCTRSISNTDAEMIWIPETWGMENYAMLSTVAQKTINQKIGSSIINIYSRSPSTIAMGAATIDTLSKGRLVLGLGTSSLPIVETFHGYKFEKPLQRMKEYVEIIRLVLSRKQVNYNGKIFNLKNFSLLIKPYRNNIPVYLAAINQKMVELTWDIADGVIFYLRPKSELKETIEKMQKKKSIDVTCQLITCISNDSEKAIQRAKKTLSFYIAVGKVYREFLANTGFENETKNIFEEYNNSGLRSIDELVSDSMLKALCISGTPEEGKKQLQEFRDTGIELPIIQFNPVGNTQESFDLLKQTFFE